MDTEPTIDTMINNIVFDKNVEAMTDFNAIIAAKLQDALDAKKVEIAQSLYGDQEAETEEDAEGEEEAEASDEQEEDTEQDSTETEPQ